MNRRDIELLSSYLDGQLKPSDSARLESRLSSDSNLRTVLDDLRSARGLLRQLPMRKAPRDFRLTPKMVGKNPPLPRAYPAFRFVTALATMLLFFTVGLNFLASQQTNFGYGGGGAPEIFSAQAPAATEAPAAEAPPEESAPELAPLPTATFSVEDTARDAVTPLARDGETGDAGEQDPLGVQSVPQGETPQPVPPGWQILLAGVALLGAIIMVLMRRLATNRWQQK
jgi:anti-sigma factor RsiW